MMTRSIRVILSSCEFGNKRNIVLGSLLTYRLIDATSNAGCASCGAAYSETIAVASEIDSTNAAAAMPPKDASCGPAGPTPVGFGPAAHLR